MIEEQIQQHAGCSSPLDRKARPCAGLQWVAVGEGIDAPVQTNGRLDLCRPTPAQRAFDEIAVEAAKQLRWCVATKMKMGQIVHPASLPP